MYWVCELTCCLVLSRSESLKIEKNENFQGFLDYEYTPIELSTYTLVDLNTNNLVGFRTFILVVLRVPICTQLAIVRVRVHVSS